MIHEKQVRQFCAVHTINNLLQLPPGVRNIALSESDKVVGKDVIYRWTCNGRILHEQQVSFSSSSSPNKHWCTATHDEFDQIAQEITIRERQVVNEDATITRVDENDDANRSSNLSSNQNLSTWQRIWSHHGTPYFGNYSFEVLQLALKRRGVKMDYFRVPESGADVIETDSNPGNCTAAASVHVGYIIYEQSSSYTSHLKRIGFYIPVLKHFCEGKHWYAITRIKYSCDQAGHSSNYGDDKKIDDAIDKSWCVIDSKLNEIETIKSDRKLMQMLRDIHKSGSLVFRITYVTNQIR